MKDIRFKNYAATGPREAQWEHAPLDVFLLTTPMFVYALSVFGVIPPLHVINEIMLLGEHDAGMGGGAEWKPFEITKDEYEELVENLVTNPEHKIIEDRELWEKPNYKKWNGALLSKHAKRVRSES